MGDRATSLELVREALVLARRAVRADEEAATDKLLESGAGTLGTSDTAMADAAANLYRNVASLLQGASRSELVAEREGAQELLERLVDCYGRRFAQVNLALHGGDWSPHATDPVQSAPVVDGLGTGAAAVSVWASTRRLVDASVRVSPLRQAPMALALAAGKPAAKAAAFRALAAPPAPLAPVLGPVHRLQCAARTTVAPGCLLGNGALLVTPDAWAPAGSAPLLHVSAKTVALRRLARAARRLAPSLCPLSFASTEQLDAALTAFADAALASHAALCKADRSVVRPLVVSCAEADAAAEQRWGAAPAARPRQLGAPSAGRGRGRSRGSTLPGGSTGFSDDESDGDAPDAEDDDWDGGAGDSVEGSVEGLAEAGPERGAEGAEAERQRRWVKRMQAASRVLRAEVTARVFRPPQAGAVGDEGGAVAEGTGWAAGTVSGLQAIAGGTAASGGAAAGAPPQRADGKADAHAREGGGGRSTSASAPRSRRGSAGESAAPGPAKLPGDVSVAGMAFRGLSDVVRATAAVAASAVAAAWQASAPSGQVIAYARAVRAAAAATEGLGMWLEAAVAGATPGCERQGPQLCLRDETAIREAESAASACDSALAASSPAVADTAGLSAAGDGTGWELARTTSDWASEPALRDWCLRAARLMESASRRRRVVAALHVIGKGLCGAIAADLALLASLRVAAAKEAALSRPALDT